MEAATRRRMEKGEAMIRKRKVIVEVRMERKMIKIQIRRKTMVARKTTRKMIKVRIKVRTKAAKTVRKIRKTKRKNDYDEFSRLFK